MTARGAGFEQRGLEPAAMLVGTLEIEVGLRALVAFGAQQVGPAARFEHEGVGRAGIEPDVEDVGNAFVVAPEFWLNLQKLYDLRMAEQTKGEEVARLPVFDANAWQKRGKTGQLELGAP